MKFVLFGPTISCSWSNGHAAPWCERAQEDEYLGALISGCPARGGRAHGLRAGQACVEVGTRGYREAMRLLTVGQAGPANARGQIGATVDAALGHA